MKQRRHGKKVYNWHRPLGRSQLRRRFLRARETHRSVDAELASLDESADLADCDIWPYEISNYCCEICYRESQGYADEEDMNLLSIRQLLDNLLHPSQWILDLERTQERLDSLEQTTTLHLSPQRAGTIEDRLAEHLELLNDSDSDKRAMQRILSVYASDLRRVQRIRSAGQAIGTPHFARLIILFSPFWIRDPMDWDASGEPLELLRFLFVQHEAPGFLFPVWLRSDCLSEIHLKWVLWLIIIGQGGSLKRASRHFPWAVSGKYQRYLLETPEDLGPVEAARLAETRRLGGSLTTFRRLQEFHYFNYDPSEEFFPHRDFWEATVRWLSKHEAELTDDDSHDILQWAIHEHTELRGFGEFCWKRRSVASCRRHADDYFTSLNCGMQDARWKAQGWDLENFQDDAGATWSVTELVDGLSLVKEGQVMRHCVALYSIRCLNGECALFSLRRQGTRQITIEVDLRQMRVVQARGKFNRAAKPEEQAAIALWFATVRERSPQ